MEDTFIKSVMELGTTGAFLTYLYIRNGKQEKASAKVAEALAKVSDSQDRNTKVLIKVAMKHRLLDEADDLIAE